MNLKLLPTLGVFLLVVCSGVARADNQEPNPSPTTIACPSFAGSYSLVECANHKYDQEGTLEIKQSGCSELVIRDDEGRFSDYLDFWSRYGVFHVDNRLTLTSDMQRFSPPGTMQQKSTTASWGPGAYPMTATEFTGVATLLNTSPQRTENWKSTSKLIFRGELLEVESVRLRDGKLFGSSVCTFKRK